MAIQFTDFSKAPLQQSAAATIFEDVLKGYKMQQEPAKMKEEQSARQLANQLKQLEVAHKPKEYDLDDRGKEYANALKGKALQHYEEKYALDKRYKEAQIKKLTQAGLNAGLKLNGAVANAEAIYQLEHDPTSDPEHVKALKDAFNVGQEHTETTTARGQKLNETQYKRDATPIVKKHAELRDIDAGKFPGTNEKISPEKQQQMKKDLLLSLVKDTTDPKTREKLINASNMNITLDSINVNNLTQYSGAINQADKIADSIIEAVGAGSPEYEAYQKEVIKATAAAKQMRQYLGDSIQPAAQDRLDHLTNPEAWNVSPKLAKDNFNFIRDLFKRETQTLVRAAQDPSLYTASGNSGNSNQDKIYNLATKRWE